MMFCLKPWTTDFVRTVTLFISLLSVPSYADEAGLAYFEKHIRPLFARHCYQCHSEKANNRESDLLLDRSQGWLLGGGSGPTLVPGDVEASIIIRAVRYADPDLQMPPIKKLSEDEIGKLETWIRMGAEAPEHIPISSDDNPSDPIAGKEHWAFQPLAAVHVPDVKFEDWPKTKIDKFILFHLEQDGLQAVSDADLRVLAKRVYFQLIGLPPTPEQMQEFVGDPSPEAYERLVDQLLASPRFGERWGRHWLDLARYSDSNGLDENFLFREAWRYRNWVIEAFNDDMPFDRFVLMQLAGDLLPFPSIEVRDQQRIASGFLSIGPKVLLGNDELNQRMEIADEQIDTIGKTLLGQTLGCARCHDHKFDPVPTADYYALAGIFASTRVMERRYMLGEQRVMEQLFGLEEVGNEKDDTYEAFWRDYPKVVQEKNHAEAALEWIKKQGINDNVEIEATFTKLVEEHRSSIADEAMDRSKSHEERLEAQNALVSKLTKLLTNPPPIPPRGMICCDVDKPADEHIRLAGQFDRLGDLVPRGFLSVLEDNRSEPIPQNESGRLSLAHWLCDPEQRSGQLTARVMANRVWHHLMGCGIVRTVDNFGRTGETPTHPELLEHLASEFIDSGWSIKSLVRQIVLSRTFRLSSAFASENDEVDPDNRLYWRANRRRLTPECFRDGLLSTAQELDLTMMKSTVANLGDQATAVGANMVRRRTDFPCRSVYLPVIRNDLPELFEFFDFANPHTTTGMRPTTTVPTQGLFMLNDSMMTQSSGATARRILENSPTGDYSGRIDCLFDIVVGTSPSAIEKQNMEAFLKRLEQQFKSQGSEDAERGGDAELRALTLACQALFASSRFQLLE